MALTDKYRKRGLEIASQREQLAVERAANSVRKLLESEQFKLSALALPESSMAVDAIIQSSVNASLNPVAQLNDTLRAKGFQPAEIRKQVHTLYDLWFSGGNTDAGSIPYEDMESAVAGYCMEHQEIYNTLTPASLRN